jgi:hypothetical protein
MEVLKMTKEFPDLLEFISKRKMKYDVYQNQLYRIEWNADTLQMRKDFYLEQKRIKYLKTHPLKKEEKKPTLSQYLRNKSSLISNHKELPDTHCL